MKQTNLPRVEEIAPGTPLRLSVAAALAFPDGSMTASGLRHLGSADTRDATRRSRRAK
jgi:hypothetical protein